MAARRSPLPWLAALHLVVAGCDREGPPSICATAQADGGPSTAAMRGALFCMDLVPVPDMQSYPGVIELHSVTNAFGVSIGADGRHRYRIVSVVDSLPAPESLGDFSSFIAWAATISMDTVVRLGEVRAGRSEIGEISWDQFRILVSAERDSAARERTGKLVLRGTSPSTRLMAHRDVTRSALLGGMGADAPPPVSAHVHSGVWPMPPMDPRLPPMPGMDDLRPDVAPYLPRVRNDGDAPIARPRELITLSDGDTLRLEAAPVRRQIAGKTFLMYGFNGRYPGPLIHVRERATIHVDYRNALDQPSTIHWHGVRLDNRFDGVPVLTQDLVQPGGRFHYEVRFPDAGIFWYHPHHREDIQQELGLYGNILVDPTAADYYGPATRADVLMLDDLLVGDAGLIPFGSESPTHMLMGRFGNVMLVNGEPDFRLAADSGDVIRFHLTNVSNTRVFNVSFGGSKMKLVASDVGRFEREEWIESVVIAPAERYIVDVRFERPGEHIIANRVRALNHMTGTFFPSTDTLGVVRVAARATAADHRAAFERLREHADVVRDIGRYTRNIERAPDQEVVLSMRVADVPPAVAAMAMGFPVPIDWNDAMGMMNWATTGKQASWVLRDAATGLENMAIQWRYRLGDVALVRIVNDPAVFHAMAHPIHVHGQRALVLRRNGVPVANRAWKDTALIQAGETVDLLIEMSNPGRWMLHCHIAEHLGGGMMMRFDVQ